MVYQIILLMPFYLEINLQTANLDSSTRYSVPHVAQEADRES